MHQNDSCEVHLLDAENECMYKHSSHSSPGTTHLHKLPEAQCGGPPPAHELIRCRDLTEVEDELGLACLQACVCPLQLVGGEEGPPVLKGKGLAAVTRLEAKSCYGKDQTLTI